MRQQSTPYYGSPGLFRFLFLLVGTAIGAFIGNLFGWFVGGLIGALIGLLIAHRAAVRNARFPDHSTPVSEERQCSMGSSKLEFLLNGIAVGYFEDSEYPRQDGRYRYVPYRSVGHYQMQQNSNTDTCVATTL